MYTDLSGIKTVDMVQIRVGKQSIYLNDLSGIKTVDKCQTISPVICRVSEQIHNFFLIPRF